MISLALPQRNAHIRGRMSMSTLSFSKQPPVRIRSYKGSCHKPCKPPHTSARVTQRPLPPWRSLAASACHESASITHPVSCQNAFHHKVHDGFKKKKKISHQDAWTVSFFRLYLAEKQVNSTDLSSPVIYFFVLMFSRYFCHAEDSYTAADR